MSDDDDDWDDLDSGEWEVLYPTKPVAADEDDEELEAYWADVRSPPRVRTSSPTLVDVRDLRPKGVPLSRSPVTSTVSDLIRARFDGREVDVQIGLFTAEGEVTAAEYTRASSRMRLEDDRVHIGAVAFPTATSDWGVVQTAAVFVEGSALFYLDLTSATNLLPGVAMNIGEMNASID